MSCPMFTNTNWRDEYQLRDALVEAGKDFSPKEKTEVERKWLVTDGPALVELFTKDRYNNPRQTGFSLRHHMVSYASTDPEIRIRETCDEYYEHIGYFVAYKSNAGEDGLVRTELEFEIPPEIYARLLTLASIGSYPFRGSLAIPRTAWIVTYDNSLSYELKVSDHGYNWQMEIEFSDEETAKNHVLCERVAPFIGADVTSDSRCKIKNYWICTRGGLPSRIYTGGKLQENEKVPQILK